MEPARQSNWSAHLYRAATAGASSFGTMFSAMFNWLLQVVTIGSTAVGIGVQCDDHRCEWDSVPFMQNNYTSGHRQLMLDCLGVEGQATRPSQNNTKVTIAQRLFSRGRSFLNVVEMRSAIKETGADVQVFNLEGNAVLCRQWS